MAKPLWGVPVPVDPGEHVIAARAPGKKAWEGRVTTAEASPAAMVIVEPLQDLPRPSTVTPPPRRVRSGVPAGVLGGVAAAGLGTGIALFAVHAGQQSDAEALSTMIKSGGTCTPPRADARCGALASNAANADTFGNASTVAFAVAGAAAVAMVTYLLLPAGPARSGGIQLSPTFLANGAGTRGIAVTGSF